MLESSPLVMHTFTWCWAGVGQVFPNSLLLLSYTLAPGTHYSPSPFLSVSAVSLGLEATREPRDSLRVSSPES